MARVHIDGSLPTRGNKMSLLAQVSGEHSVSTDTLWSGMLVAAGQFMTKQIGGR